MAFISEFTVEPPAVDTNTIVTFVVTCELLSAGSVTISLPSKSAIIFPDSPDPKKVRRNFDIALSGAVPFYERVTTTISGGVSVTATAIDDSNTSRRRRKLKVRA